MKVSIKDFSVSMELKNKGIELEVRDNDDTFLGDLIITKANVTWCQGKKQKSNGVQKSWKELIVFFTE